MEPHRRQQAADSSLGEKIRSRLPGTQSARCALHAFTTLMPDKRRDRADELTCLRLFGIGGRSGIRGEPRRCLGGVYDFIWQEQLCCFPRRNA
jgi:hypothetical protein